MLKGMSVCFTANESLFSGFRVFFLSFVVCQYAHMLSLSMFYDSQYLYTLVVEDEGKAEKLHLSLPPGLNKQAL